MELHTTHYSIFYPKLKIPINKLIIGIGIDSVSDKQFPKIEPACKRVYNVSD